MKEPKVSVIILNWNGLENALECLEHLQKITYPNYEVIVADNGSSGNDAQVLREKFGGYIHLIENSRNLGYVVANNMAMKHAIEVSNPRYFLLLNNDAVVAPDFLTEMVKVAEADKSNGIVGAKFYFYDDPNRIQFVGSNFNPWLGDVMGTVNGIQRVLGRKEYDHGQHDFDREVGVVPGWCELIKREVIEKVGMLNEDYFAAWEEVDYCLKAKDAGFKVMYAHKAKVWHKWRTATALDGYIQYHGTRLRFQLMKQHLTKLQYLSFLTFFFSIHIWLATAYYLVWLHKPRIVGRLYKGVWHGLLGMDECQ